VSEAATKVIVGAAGTAVSTVIETVLFASAPSAFAFPAASVNFVLATLIEAPVVLSAVGVKVTE
jgi:hypothetical protein